MSQFWDCTEQLFLISMSVRAMRDEKSAKGLADWVCKSCPICGELSISGLNKDFVGAGEDRDETGKKAWRLPGVEKKVKVEEKIRRRTTLHEIPR
jgi:hypothetical protein